jgi:multimeric flavodoxin WrbA
MKILAIMGSPKGKGAGYKIVQKIEEELNKLGEVSMEYLFLKEANLELCREC